MSLIERLCFQLRKVTSRKSEVVDVDEIVRRVHQNMGKRQQEIDEEKAISRSNERYANVHMTE